MKIPEQGKLLRIFIGESDRWHGRPLYTGIVEAPDRGRALLPQLDEVGRGG